MNDLFGHPIPEKSLPTPSSEKGKRKPTKPNGYAAIPGTGPTGETCRTCAHLARVRHSKKYLKCLLERHRWTNGPGTDIRASSPACKRWEPKPKLVWCVQHDHGWCAAGKNEEPREGSVSVATRCGHFVTLPYGYKLGRPTCDECKKYLAQ